MLILSSYSQFIHAVSGLRRSHSTQQEFTVNNLQLLSWNNHGGERKTYSVAENVKHKWQNIAILLGFQVPDITSLKSEHSNDAIRCLIEIFDQWIRNAAQQSSDRYCPTWDGLLTLLYDIEEASVAKYLTEILCL